MDTAEEKSYPLSLASDALLENQRLLQRIGQLETEREILKKSLGHYQLTDLRPRYELVRELASEFAVESLCSVVEVSRTAYYRYLRGHSYKLTPEKAEYQQLIEQTFAKHKRRYGSRRITAELQEKGHFTGRHQVRTLMKKVGLQAIQRQRPTYKSFVPRTTDSTQGRGYWPNLLLD